MKISIIAAIGKNNEIGRKNTLLWNMPADMKHFKDTTSGKTVIMGQKTFESLGKPLPNRRNIVLTLDKKFKADNIEIAYSVEEALKLARTSPQPSPDKGEGAEEVFVIGGGQIYKLFMNIADKLYITHVNATFKDADTFFPEIIPIVFGETKREKHKKDENNLYDYDFVEYERF